MYAPGMGGQFIAHQQGGGFQSHQGQAPRGTYSNTYIYGSTFRQRLRVAANGRTGRASSSASMAESLDGAEPIWWSAEYVHV